jgi:hypothetical protein
MSQSLRGTVVVANDPDGDGFVGLEILFLVFITLHFRIRSLLPPGIL